MILFMIRKAFFDMWDHLFSIVLLNVGFTLLIGVNLGMFSIFGVHSVMVLLGIGVGTILIVLYIGIASMFARDIADYKSPEFKRFLQYIKDVWKPALALSFLIFLQFLILFVIFPWYRDIGGLFGIAAIGLLFWISLIWWFASQYYFPLRSRLDTKVTKIFRKCLLLFFDNTLLTLVLGFGSLILVLLSSLTAFILPGMGTILIWHQVGLKLRLYKYDYLEKHPEADSKKIPWEVLLLDDRERVGRRTLRNMIFPWKE